MEKILNFFKKIISLLLLIISFTIIIGVTLTFLILIFKFYIINQIVIISIMFYISIFTIIYLLLKSVLKLVIKILNRNTNKEILEKYYNLNYEYDLDEEAYKYKLDEYHNYKVINFIGNSRNNLILEKKKNNNFIYDDIDYNRENYYFHLPLHIDIVNKLNLKMDKKKYINIYILIELDNRESHKDTICEFVFQSVYKKGINFIYSYRTMVYTLDNIMSEKLCVEFLININNQDKEKIISELMIHNKINTFEITLLDDVTNYFNKNLLLSRYSFNKYILSHLDNGFFVYESCIDLLDYYLLGNYMMEHVRNVKYKADFLMSLIMEDLSVRFGIIYDMDKERIIKYKFIMNKMKVKTGIYYFTVPSESKNNTKKLNTIEQLLMMTTLVKYKNALNYSIGNSIEFQDHISTKLLGKEKEIPFFNKFQSMEKKDSYNLNTILEYCYQEKNNSICKDSFVHQLVGPIYKFLKINKEVFLLAEKNIVDPELFNYVQHCLFTTSVHSLIDVTVAYRIYCGFIMDNFIKTVYTNGNNNFQIVDVIKFSDIVNKNKKYQAIGVESHINAKLENRTDDTVSISPLTHSSSINVKINGNEKAEIPNLPIYDYIISNGERKTQYASSVPYNIDIKYLSELYKQKSDISSKDNILLSEQCDVASNCLLAWRNLMLNITNGNFTHESLYKLITHLENDTVIINIYNEKGDFTTMSITKELLYKYTDYFFNIN